MFLLGLMLEQNDCADQSLNISTKQQDKVLLPKIMECHKSYTIWKTCWWVYISPTFDAVYRDVVIWVPKHRPALASNRNDCHHWRNDLAVQWYEDNCDNTSLPAGHAWGTWTLVWLDSVHLEKYGRGWGFLVVHDVILIVALKWLYFQRSIFIPISYVKIVNTPYLMTSLYQRG